MTELVGNNACISLNSLHALAWSSKARVGPWLGLREDIDGEKADFLSKLVCLLSLYLKNNITRFLVKVPTKVIVLM